MDHADCSVAGVVLISMNALAASSLGNDCCIVLVCKRVCSIGFQDGSNSIPHIMKIVSTLCSSDGI